MQRALTILDLLEILSQPETETGHQAEMSIPDMVRLDQVFGTSERKFAFANTYPPCERCGNNHPSAAETMRLAALSDADLKAEITARLESANATRQHQN